jgi:hypothetical protein
MAHLRRLSDERHIPDEFYFIDLKHQKAQNALLNWR